MTETTDKELEQSVENIVLGIGQGEMTIFNQTVTLKPMPYKYEREALTRFGEMVKKINLENSIDGKIDPSAMITIVTKLLTGILGFEWLEILPELVKIISNSYGLNISIETIQEQISIPVMCEIVLRQYKCDQESSKVSLDFFVASLGKIPGLTQIKALLDSVNHLLENLNLHNYLSSSDLQKDTELPQPS
jgi:hypothetical protein